MPARRSPAKEPVAERLLRRAPPTRRAVREGEQRPARAVRAAAAAALVEALRLWLRAARVDVLLVDKAAVQERACPPNGTFFNFSICVPSLPLKKFILELQTAPKRCFRTVLRLIQDGFVHDADEVLAILMKGLNRGGWAICRRRELAREPQHLHKD
eukprot:COSAG06_NODE_829_length_12043_cov_8.656983_12_plen_157_part_00